MNKEYFKQELLRDNGVLQDKKLPFLKRIAFESDIDFYVTRLYVAQKPFPTGKTNGRMYRICQWNDSRIQAALSAEIGEYAPLFNGNTSAVELVGNFEYQANLFSNVRYESVNSKVFFNDSQIQEVLGKEYQDVTQVKTPTLIPNNAKNEAIDIGEFAQLTEVIPTGKSGKALWAQGTYIIDGPAGTGKSTIALHKVKILEETIKIEKILILVKNKSIIENFKILMKKLKINNINIQTIEDYTNSNFIFSALELERGRKEIKNDIDDFMNFYSCYQHKTYYEGQRGQYFDEYDSLNKNIGRLKKETLEPNQDIYNEWGMICKYEKIVSEISTKDEEFSIKDAESLHLICRKLNIDCSFAFDLIQFQKIFNSIKDTYSKKIKQLSNNAQEIKKLENQLKKLEQKYNEIFERELNAFLKRYTTSVFKKYFIEFFIKQHSFLEFLRLKYYNLYSLLESMLNSYRYHTTIIIDEAQDVEVGIIESVRLNAENLILTGDPLQRTEKNGVGDWKRLIYFDSIYQNKIYSLSHNYRQTYELAQVAYNYREILLKKPLSNIEAEYFENQKGFHYPACCVAKFDNVVFETTKIIMSKLEYRKDFKQDFPIVLICKDDKQRSFFSVLIENARFSAKDLLIMSVQESYGREFPIVIAYIDSETSQNDIYVLLTRARYDFTFFTFESSYEFLNKSFFNLLRQN